MPPFLSENGSKRSSIYLHLQELSTKSLYRVYSTSYGILYSGYKSAKKKKKKTELDSIICKLLLYIYMIRVMYHTFYLGLTL